ncbi:hypothetical protein T492DRAFT_469535 [Pavlovales sp. CCMP2436]|nr:hypothetical protein T492DRAFT_469535 [Pavlovales sp. CCMP2436]
MITVTYVPGNPGSNPGQRSSSVLTAARRPGTHSRSGERRERLAEAPRATHWAGESGTRHVRAIELLKKILTRAAVQRKALGSSPSFWRNGRRGRAGRVQPARVAREGGSRSSHRWPGPSKSRPAPTPSCSLDVRAPRTTLPPPPRRLGTAGTLTAPSRRSSPR